MLAVDCRRNSDRAGFGECVGSPIMDVGALLSEGPRTVAQTDGRE
jgi:hypothetical protein